MKKLISLHNWLFSALAMVSVITAYASFCLTGSIYGGTGLVMSLITLTMLWILIAYLIAFIIFNLSLSKLIDDLELFGLASFIYQFVIIIPMLILPVCKLYYYQ